MERHQRNGILTMQEQTELKGKKICIVGCGGLGGYLAEMLGRIGIGEITLIDGDVFVPSNLNRQLLALPENLGKSKVEAAKLRLLQIDETIVIHAHEVYLDAQNGRALLIGHDVVLDALDQIPTRFTLQAICRDLAIPMIHGAIAGWYGHVTTIMPLDDTLFLLYKGKSQKGVEIDIGNPSFTPACIASFQVAETIKVLTGKGELLSKRVLYIDLLSGEVEMLDFSE